MKPDTILGANRHHKSACLCIQRTHVPLELWLTRQKMEIRDIWFFTSLHEGALYFLKHSMILIWIFYFISNYKARETVQITVVGGAVKI